MAKQSEEDFTVPSFVLEKSVEINREIYVPGLRKRLRINFFTRRFISLENVPILKSKNYRVGN